MGCTLLVHISSPRSGQKASASGDCTGIVRALYGHCRALYGRCTGIVRALNKRVSWKHLAKYSLGQQIPNSLQELQRLSSHYMVPRKAGAEKQKQYVSG